MDECKPLIRGVEPPQHVLCRPRLGLGHVACPDVDLFLALNSVSESPVTLRSSKSVVYLLKDRSWVWHTVRAPFTHSGPSFLALNGVT